MEIQPWPISDRMSMLIRFVVHAVFYVFFSCGITVLFLVVRFNFFWFSPCYLSFLAAFPVWLEKLGDSKVERDRIYHPCKFRSFASYREVWSFTCYTCNIYKNIYIYICGNAMCMGMHFQNWPFYNKMAISLKRIPKIWKQAVARQSMHACMHRNDHLQVDLKRIIQAVARQSAACMHASGNDRIPKS